MHFFASVAIFCYCLLYFGLAQFALSPNILSIWTKIFSIGAFFVIPALINLLLFISQAKKGLPKYLFILSCVLGASSFFLWTDIFPLKLNYFFWGTTISIESIPYFHFFVNTALVLPLCIILCWVQKRKDYASRFGKSQINFNVFNITLGGLGILLNFLPGFGIELYHIGPPLLTIAFIGISYSIIGRRFLELDLIVNRTAQAILFIVPLLLLNIFISGVCLEALGFLFSTTFSFMVIIAILLFTPYKKLIRNIADKAIYRGRYDYQKILQELCQTLVSMLNLDQLLNSIVCIIVQTIDVEKIAMFLEDEESQDFTIRACHGLDKETQQKLVLKENDKIVQLMKKNAKILVKAELKQFENASEVEELFEKLNTIDAELGIPLFFKEHLVGILFISKKKSEHIYNQGDIDVLNAFAAEASVAIENARLYSEAIIDGLTKLFHHNYFFRRLKEEIARAKRYAHPVALLMIDIDHFKDFNDTYGHQAGDLFLKQLGALLKVKLRNVDVPARYGGEEFAIILPEVGPKNTGKAEEEDKRYINTAVLVAERLRTSFEAMRIEYEGKKLWTTVSIGVACFDGIDKQFEAEKFVKQADRALYQAKDAGRNKVIFYYGER